MSAENVKVFIRFRDNKTDGVDAVKFHDGCQVTVKSTAMKEKGLKKVDYRFDRIWEGDSEQQEVYAMLGQPLLRNIFEGYNSTLFVYGQTGSGKTYTMFGPDGGKMGNEGGWGIVPRVLKELFLRIAELEKQRPDTTYDVTMSIVDIYLEKVRDLLNKEVVKKNSDANNLRVRYDKKIGVYITYPGDRSRLATEYAAKSGQDAMGLIDNAIRIRKKTGGQAKTKMNEFSSRSHLVISVKLKETSPAGIKTSKLLLCDLAGSEKTRNTGSQGMQLKQAQNINYGLSMLGNVLNALTDRHRAARLAKGTATVPFRDSKLTAILQDSLGGNCKTALICTCRPDDKYYSETRSTLRFGNNAKKIKNQVRKNEVLTVAQYKKRMKLYESRIHDFQQDLAMAGERIELQTNWSLALEEDLAEKGINLDDFAEKHNLMTSKQIERRYTLLAAAAHDEQKEGEGTQLGIVSPGFGKGRRASFGGWGSLGNIEEGGAATTRSSSRVNAKLQFELKEAREEIHELRSQLNSQMNYCEELEGRNYDYAEAEQEWQETANKLREQQGINYQYKEDLKNLKDKVHYLEQHNKEFRDGTRTMQIDLIANARASSFANTLAMSHRELKRVQKAFEEGRCEDVVAMVSDLVEQTKEIEKLKKSLEESHNHNKSLHALQDRERETRSRNETEILEVWTKYKHEKCKWEVQGDQYKYRIEMLEKQVEELREARDESRTQLRRAEGGMNNSEIKRALNKGAGSSEFYKFLRASNLERKLKAKNIRRVPKKRRKRPQTEGHELRLSMEQILDDEDQLALDAGVVSPTA